MIRKMKEYANNGFSVELKKVSNRYEVQMHRTQLNKVELES